MGFVESSATGCRHGRRQLHGRETAAVRRLRPFQPPNQPADNSSPTHTMASAAGLKNAERERLSLRTEVQVVQ
ncbi:unnamed protein product [Angiostrongylus costaricensis]|uniref:Uncharacterized protein n=1 Tax=Angiostrongylus costaricensis TaxID=334426 RepID=A0A0R3PQ14_ANGCS|nr:unnamed protein product [Angiostrongylus costaricensis]